MDTYRAVVGKRDQRAFLPRPLADEALRRILQAGRMTGSSKNREPNRFVIVRDRERLTALGGLSRFGAWVADAALLVVIAQTERHDFDAGRCAQNMLLAGWNEGVGGSPNGVADRDAANALVGVPEGESIAIVLSFGYPARPRDPDSRSADEWSARARRKPLDELIERRG